MDSRFKFLSTVDPNAVPSNQIKSRFNKLTLATSTISKMEACNRKETINAEVSTFTTTTVIQPEEIVAVPTHITSKGTNATNSGQKPKIMLYESTMTSKNATNLNEAGADVMTDDDTNSVSSTSDHEFANSISIDTTAKTPRLDANDGMLNLSQRFGGMDLVHNIDTMPTEQREDLDETAMTLSSTESAPKDQPSNVTTSNRSSKSSVIVLSDTEEEEEEVDGGSDQPPLKIIPRPMEDYNVSSSLPSTAVASLPSSTLMHKINKFFDNVPSMDTSSLNESMLSIRSAASGDAPHESIHVSESTCDDDSKNDTVDTDNQSARDDNIQVNIEMMDRSSPSVIPETCYDPIEDELADVGEVRNVPVTKSSSDQVRPVTKTLSGIKLTTTNSTPIIESSVRSADGVKRSNSNNLSAAVKLNKGSTGQLNIAAKININIQISNNDTSTSEESSPETSLRDEGTVDTPAIESEPIPDQSEQNQSNADSLQNSSVDDLPETQAKSTASSPERRPSLPQIKLVCATPKTPSAIDRVKSFEFVAPKSMTKSDKPEQLKTPKRKEKTPQANKENLQSEETPEGFVVDETIGVDPKDQLLLHQVYGDAWKTPEVLRSYSAVKGRPLANQHARVIQSAQPSYRSRISRGFNLFKRNIVDDLDSTRWEELSDIEPDEISPLKECQAKYPTISEEKSMNSPEAKSMPVPEPEPLVTPRRKKVQKSLSDGLEDTVEKECTQGTQPTPSTSTTKRNTKLRNVQQSNVNTPVDCSQSLLNPIRSNKKTPAVTKPNQPQTPSERIRSHLNKICDSDTESESEEDLMTSDDDWNDKKDVSSYSSSSSSSEEEYTPRTNRKRGQLAGTASTTSKASTTRKNRPAKGQKLVYLDLSSEEVTEANGNGRANVSEEDLAEITRKFLESDLNDASEPKETAKPLRRKLFTPNYEEVNVDDFFQTDKRSTKAVAGKPKENDEVKLKIPIPVFKSLTRHWIQNEGFATPTTPAPKAKTRTSDEGSQTPKSDFHLATDTTYSFLQSLDVISSLRLCHPDALKYRKNFNPHREELADVLYKLFNEKIFDGKMGTTISWNNKLLTTAGRCHCSSRNGRTARIELSTKVITSADRLRCTLIHEMCHAAVWLFNGEHGGHGTKWKEWAARCNKVFPELPIIARCHNYEIEYKYTYQCDICHSKSNAHTKSKKVENIRCSYCHGSISVFLNKKQKDGKIVQTPVRAASGFAKFVKEKYKDFKLPGVTHAEVMRSISGAFASLSVEEKKKY